MATMTDTISSGAANAASKGKGWVEPLARLGYVAKGVVYTIIGILAVQVAWGTGGSIQGSQGAIKTIASQPFGSVLLILTALGLVGYVTWRFVQAVLDPDNKGTDATGLVKRVGYAVSGVTYALLAFSAVRLVLSGSSGGGNAQQTWTARLLSQPFGQWLVGIVGAIIIGVGLYHFYRAYKASFMKHYNNDMSAQEKHWAKRIGRFGLSARGVTFLIIGGFFIQAARQSDASEAQGLDAALTTLAQQSYGPWLLGVVALGFVAYGIYCFSRARYRRFEVH
ncbi:MAG TPA: DUF1206 domain-containing protein [Rhodothermales bacterium]|nr:DUF1206 domain-containing protein [Rhodothermales bacterium]